MCRDVGSATWTRSNMAQPYLYPQEVSDLAGHTMSLLIGLQLSDAYLGRCAEPLKENLLKLLVLIAS